MSTFKDVNIKESLNIKDHPLDETYWNGNSWYIKKYHNGIVIGGVNHTRTDVGITDAYGTMYQSTFSEELPYPLKDRSSMLGCWCNYARYGTGASWGIYYGIVDNSHIQIRAFDLFLRQPGAQSMYVSFTYIGFFE